MYSSHYYDDYDIIDQRQLPRKDPPTYTKMELYGPCRVETKPEDPYSTHSPVTTLRELNMSVGPIVTLDLRGDETS